MKNYLYIYLFIHLFIGCQKKTNTPKELRETVWINVTLKEGEFYKMCELRDYYKTRFNGDLMSFVLMSDEYETVKEAKPTEKGYKISFLDSEYGSINYVFNFEWVDKQRGISFWRYINNNIEDEEAFSFYAIDSVYYDKLPNLPCIECFGKERCESLSEKELEFFDASWKVNCNDTETQLVGLNPISEFYLDFLFQDQERARILVKVKKDLNEDEKYNLTYVMLTGITRTNRNLDWFDFSKDSIIGNISLINEKEFQFNWKGFYNKRTKRWESENFVFDNKYTKPLILKKCNN